MTLTRPAILSLAAAGIFLAAHAPAQTPPPLRIMPLGDSITYGSSTPGGYRLPLYVALTNAGYNVDYVGTRTDNGATGLPDANHQGLSGWRITGTGASNNGLDETLYQWLNVIDDPDVVLLHIGTNDFGTTNDIDNAVNRLDALVSRIATNRPSAHIIVTTLLPRNEPYNSQITTLFNPYVEGKASGQQALGRKVHFLDMYSHLTTNDLYDSVHPSAAGYAKMADAWHTAVTNIIAPYGDAHAPAISRALGNVNLTQVTVTFTKPLNPATATNLANYAIDGGLSLAAASLSADQRKVTLTTTPQASDTVYTLTVNNVTDVTPSPGPLTIAADSAVSFRAVCRGYLANIPEASGYLLAYSLDLPSSAKYGRGAVPYSVDNSLAINGLPLDRIAYYVELQCPNTPLTYLWISMPAFTNDTTKIGVPTLATGVVLQQYLAGLTVQCNDPAITAGTDLLGNIEFWPSNYSAPNSLNVTNASGTVYDWGDEPTAGTYGCMQLHNWEARQTLFTFSNWGTESINGATPDIGIGNCPSPRNGGVDWTFSNDAGMYSIRTLQILVKRGAASDTTPPTLTSAQAGFAGNLVQAVFSEALAPDSITCGNFTLDNGVEVITATLLPDLLTVNLTTTPQPVASTLTLAVSGVRDSVGGNPVAPGTSVAVAAPATLPDEIAANAGALADGYRLVYTLDIPVRGFFNGTNNPYRFNQSCATNTFDRVAYYLELQKNPKVAPQYVWVSMDAFTPYLSKIGVPTAASKAVFQQYVSNLDVKSNVSGISNGTAMAGGNLEFWPTDYAASNALSVAGASNGNYDFGDERRTTGAHGSMQVHNFVAKQTLFGMSNWGGDNNLIALGIGNCPSPVSAGVDWTFAENAGSYSRRRLHVLARPCAATATNLPAQVAANVPGAAGYQHLYTIDLPVKGDFNTNAAAYYSVNNYAADMGAFRRVAYYFELQQGGDPAQFIWTAMDAFTTDARKLGIPVNGTFFQQAVDNLDVFSNVGGIANGDGLATGNIEMWPSNYGTGNTLNIPNADGATFDFGDGGGSSTGGGHGCMQVHNYGASQTLFAINHFNGLNTIELGIGNRTSGNPDWTFANNAASYDSRRLYVFVLPGGDTSTTDQTKPTLSRAVGSTSLRRVTVTFSEAMADLSANPANFSIPGLEVTDAVLLPGNTAIQLATSLQTPGATNTITVSGARDRSPKGNLIRPASTVTFVSQAEALPPILADVPEAAGYSLIHKLAVANTVNYASGANYLVDESYPQTQAIDRVAYCLELLGTNGIAQWAYVSMDAFTEDLYRIGLPTGDRGGRHQQYVSNLNVYASENMANVTVTTGVGIVAGNIEFWPNNYGGANAKSIPGASGSAYDFGDTIDANTPVGHGCMQVHNYLNAHTILSMTSFGSNNRTPGLGIGNRTGVANDLDWTTAYNAPAFSTKNVYVLAHWGSTPPGERSGTPPTLLSQPRAMTVHEREGFFFSVQAMGATRYQWRRNGVIIPGAILSFLKVPAARLTDEGVYDVLIFGSGSASATSAGATLDVISQGTHVWFK